MRRRTPLLALLAASALVLAACSEDDQASSSPTTPPTAASTPGSVPSTSPTTSMPMDDHAAQMDDADRVTALLATAGFQDVATAEAAGYASSLDTLGCFQDPAHGGMGVHYIDQRLLDGNVDIATPEALVYELDADGHIAGLVAHEYIVPNDAWQGSDPPELFGMPFHEHPTLPLWVLHAWVWKDNPTGVFEDWNPAVRLCPADVPIFGRDLPTPAPAPTAGSTPASASDGTAAVVRGMHSLRPR
jgi:hypothetical protein